MLTRTEIWIAGHSPYNVLNYKNIGLPAKRQKGSGPRAGFWTERGTSGIAVGCNMPPKMKSFLSRPLGLEQNKGNYGTYALITF